MSSQEYRYNKNSSWTAGVITLSLVEGHNIPTCLLFFLGASFSDEDMASLLPRLSDVIFRRGAVHSTQMMKSKR